jgi:molybdopterin adenylyltransferase
MGTKEHKDTSPRTVKAAVISISTTRGLAEDQSGKWIKNAVSKEGHQVVLHRVVPDEVQTIRDTVLEVIREYEADVLLLTGGTGISPKDLTIEAVRPLFDKELSSFAALFAQLSFERIDSAAMLSRAAAGVVGRSVVFCMPGSLDACKVAVNDLILPEMGHLIRHIRES